MFPVRFSFLDGYVRQKTDPKDPQTWCGNAFALFLVPPLGAALASRSDYALLCEALLIGEFERGKVEDITGLKNRAARDVLYALTKKGLLVSDTPRGPVRLGFPIDVVERWFPLLYPSTR